MATMSDSTTDRAICGSIGRSAWPTAPAAPVSNNLSSMRGSYFIKCGRVIDSAGM